MTKGEFRPIALIGLMGAGKTTVARLLGEWLAVSVADLDAMIEAEEGRPIAELFEREGEPYFRQRERESLERLSAARIGVVACGGGVVLDPQCRELLRTHYRVVWLLATATVAAGRLKSHAAERPLLAGGDLVERLGELLESRRKAYEETATLRVETGGRDSGSVTRAVLDALGEPR